jgi:hypothetical protein
MRYSLPASVALCGLFALSALFPAASRAQINGVPASVTSPGFGGRPINGTRPSVTSLGPNGYAPNSRVTFSMSPPPNGRDHHRGHHYVEYVPPVIYAVPLPYAVDISDTDEYAEANAESRDTNYQGGPTIFDRRGSGADSYIPPVKDVPIPHATQPADAAPAPPEPPQEPTLLIFKDGHTLEVGNYAIVGATLFDLTPGHARRIALAELDLDATRKQNDDRGIIFQLPASPQAN